MWRKALSWILVFCTTHMSYSQVALAEKAKLPEFAHKAVATGQKSKNIGEWFLKIQSSLPLEARLFFRDKVRKIKMQPMPRLEIKSGENLVVSNQKFSINVEPVDSQKAILNINGTPVQFKPQWSPEQAYREFERAVGKKKAAAFAWPSLVETANASPLAACAAGPVALGVCVVGGLVIVGVLWAGGSWLSGTSEAFAVKELTACMNGVASNGQRRCTLVKCSLDADEVRVVMLGYGESPTHYGIKTDGSLLIYDSNYESPINHGTVGAPSGLGSGMDVRYLIYKDEHRPLLVKFAACCKKASCMDKLFTEVPDSPAAVGREP